MIKIVTSFRLPQTLKSAVINDKKNYTSNQYNYGYSKQDIKCTQFEPQGFHLLDFCFIGLAGTLYLIRFLYFVLGYHLFYSDSLGSSDWNNPFTTRVNLAVSPFIIFKGGSGHGTVRILSEMGG
jgi:hypothetical protein